MEPLSSHFAKMSPHSNRRKASTTSISWNGLSRRGSRRRTKQSPKPTATMLAITLAITLVKTRAILTMTAATPIIPATELASPAVTTAL